MLFGASIFEKISKTLRKTGAAYLKCTFFQDFSSVCVYSGMRIVQELAADFHDVR